MSFMFHSDQWDDNWDQYKVDLENENKRLRKENKELKNKIKELKLQLPPYTLSYVQKLKWIKDKGYGLIEAKKVLDKFNGDPEKAVHYLQIRGDAFCRKKPNGKKWTEQDYIDYVNSFEF